MTMEKEKLVTLVTEAQKGNKYAMNDLFNAFYNDLYYFALKTVKNDDLALDITQEAFVEIINTLGNLKEPATFVTWAKMITYHQCTRYFKKKKDVLVDENEDGSTMFDTLKEENAEFIPDEALDKDDFKKTILSILDELSEEQRSATMMFYFDELSIKQIATIQCVSENTVKSRLNYARKAIKNSVEEYEKKHNVRLRAVACLPLIQWIFSGAFEGGISMASAQIMAEGIAATTGTVVTVTTAATASTATTAVAATTTTGVVAGTTAAGIGAKIAVGVIAAAVAIGGAATTAVLIDDNTDLDDDIHYGSQDTMTFEGITSVNGGASAHVHRWGEWEIVFEPTVQQEGTSQRSCTTCPAIEKKSVEKLPILCYSQSRVQDSTLTLESVVTKALSNAENVSGSTGSQPPYECTYTADYAASCFKDMDIFGYNITEEEMLEQNWGKVWFHSFYTDYTKDELSFTVKSAYSNVSLPFETKDDLLIAAKRDIQKFSTLLNGRSDLTVDYGSQVGQTLDSITADVLKEVSDGSGNSLNISTSKGVLINDVTCGFNLTISSKEENGIYYYRLSYGITFLNMDVSNQ